MTNLSPEQKKCPKCGGERDINEAPNCWHCKNCPFAECAIEPEIKSKKKLKPKHFSSWETSKIECDNCGSRYPETSKKCSICASFNYEFKKRTSNSY